MLRRSELEGAAFSGSVRFPRACFALSGGEVEGAAEGGVGQHYEEYGGGEEHDGGA